MSEVLAPEAFIQDLVARIQARRTFGSHPLWLELADGKLSREHLKLFAVQFFLQVREFPRAVSAMHANCPFPEERMKLAESIYEEDTGRLSGCNLPHPEIFIRFGEAVGLTRAEMVEGRPLPATRALIDWFELSSKQRSFIEAAAAMNLAAEGQVPGAFGPMARRLQENYGLSREAVEFWELHERPMRSIARWVTTSSSAMRPTPRPRRACATRSSTRSTPGGSSSTASRPQSEAQEESPWPHTSSHSTS